MALVKAGAHRQEMHEVIREHSLKAWAEVAAARPNPLLYSLCADERIAHYLELPVVRSLLDAHSYIGDAPERARRIATKIKAL
jgi:adenylosuccinate lyase